ncbi:hypothetical protein EIP91_010143 [Steccherinum ochraceum]|uniref:GST C-terminal domain-containing protein n=1 Tax=Steccherinum ochraceum TaxID=92696 RepID=A0A4V2MXU5_9APHY|nr:hypothetical protein EIP91_010143 [Steccherinum ochraceum]
MSLVVYRLVHAPVTLAVRAKAGFDSPPGRPFYEVDPYKKPAELLEVSPKGLVPGLKLNTYRPPRAVNESTVILEYLEDVASTTTKRSLLPPVSDPYARALIRLQADHVNRTLVPAFYRYIQAQDEEKQVTGAKDFVDALIGLVMLFERAEAETTTDFGLWKKDGRLSLADVMAGPWIFRATNVLVHYRGFVLPAGERFREYVDRLVNHPTFKRTCSTEQLYLDSYERSVECLLSLPGRERDQLRKGFTVKLYNVWPTVGKSPEET